MWKYSCKTHLKVLFAAFVVGVVIMVIAFPSSEALYREVFPTEVVDFMYKNVFITYFTGGLSISALANAVLLIQILMRKVQFGIFILLAILYLQPTIIMEIGLFGLIPSIIAFSYGAISLHNDKKKEMQAHNFSKEEDLVKLYQSRHTLDESIRPLAEQIRRNNDKLNAIYALGIIALICVMVFISNFIVLVIAFLFYTYAFTYLNRYKAANLIPIKALLYEKCDPEACASAIIYYSYKHNKFRCKDQALMAQCLIYLDDPALADMFLISYPRANQASELTYYSIKAYISYLLKDEEKLNECKEKASQVRVMYGPVGVRIQSVEILSIQNKVDLLNANFNVCRKYYLTTYQNAKFAFQQVDAAYYIAMISFVEEDYVVAKTYFEKVIQKGNKMFFVEKAEKYLSKINAMEVSEESV